MGGYGILSKEKKHDCGLRVLEIRTKILTNWWFRFLVQNREYISCLLQLYDRQFCQRVHTAAACCVFDERIVQNAIAVSQGIVASANMIKVINAWSSHILIFFLERDNFGADSRYRMDTTHKASELGFPFESAPPFESSLPQNSDNGWHFPCWTHRNRFLIGLILQCLWDALQHTHVFETRAHKTRWSWHKQSTRLKMHTAAMRRRNRHKKPMRVYFPTRGRVCAAAWAQA